MEEGRMPDVSFSSLAVIMAVAFGAPLVLGMFPRVRVPEVVVEIVLGIVIGPSVLGWAEADEVVGVLGIVGLAFLLFLGGLELDLRRLRGPTAHRAGAGFALSLALAVLCGAGLGAVGLTDDPLLAGVILTATSLGLVIPTLKEAGHVSSGLGQLVIAGASIADFAAILLLSALFSADGTGPTAKVVLLVEFSAVVAVTGLLVGASGHSKRLTSLLVRLQDTTAEIRVRGAVLLLVVLVVLAEEFGLETILGAFIAGALVGYIDRDPAMTHPHFRLKLEAIGYGFVIPVFFVSSGITFDLDALRDSPSTLALVPVFLAALLVARGVPAIVYRPLVGERGVVVAGLLQATSLPFIVTASEIGVSAGTLEPATAAAFVAAGLASALVFPAAALTLLRSWTGPTTGAPEPAQRSATPPSAVDAGPTPGGRPAPAAE
jgi:Kef-type K+ transport system membrane component KefB